MTLHAVIDVPDVGDSFPWLRLSEALCGVGGGRTVMRVTPEHEFSTEGTAFLPKYRVCRECVPIWSARFAEPVPGFDRECARCERTLPVTSFRSDGRRADGISTICENCRAQAKRG